MNPGSIDPSRSNRTTQFESLAKGLPSGWAANKALTPIAAKKLLSSLTGPSSPATAIATSWANTKERRMGPRRLKAFFILQPSVLAKLEQRLNENCVRANSKTTCLDQ